MLVENVDLAKLDRAFVGLDRKRGGPELHIADDLAVHLGDAEAVARIGEFLRPCLGRELGEECGQVLRAVEMGEGVAEALSEHAVDGRQVGDGGVAVVHSNPAGAGQSGE